MCAIKVSFRAYNCKHLFSLILPKKRYNAILSLETKERIALYLANAIFLAHHMLYTLNEYGKDIAQCLLCLAFPDIQIMPYKHFILII